MQTFIDDVLDQVLSKPKMDIANTTFVLPSKRAGGFLKNQLKAKTSKTAFAPKVLSIEDFIVEITGLKSLDNTNSLFRFYDIYKALTPQNEQEGFETFYGWAQTLVYDFNEIDRYLIDTTQFFNYLADIKDLEHWSFENQQTDLIKNYLKFWNKLPEYYEAFVKSILKQNEAYQGLIYRKASEDITNYLQETKNPIVFIGFNALSNAEQKIIQTVLNEGKGHVFWDIDQQFFNDKQHEAGLFMRNYKKTWPYFSTEQNEFNWIGENFKNSKQIESIGIPKNVGQAKYVAEILTKISAEELKSTALVLNDEGLLSPLLNSLPETVDSLNITMGLALKATPLAALFELLFKTQEETSTNFYYKNVIEILNHPAVNLALGRISEELQRDITTKNRVFISKEKILELSTANTNKILSVCFSDYGEDVQKFTKALTLLTKLLRPKNPSDYPIETEYLYHFNKLFKKLQNLLDKHNPISNIKALHRIYDDMLTTESLDFSGSPFEGLQLMGMLETRVLDFETVILTSVNEGVLPSGKTNNSFIPYDLKKEYGLPTYKEKDAVYTYHFYRLLQRAKKVYLLYNTDKTGFNAGEKSRFITQIEVEHLPSHQFQNKLVNPKVPALSSDLQKIEKTPEVLRKLEDLAGYGFSPSALITYIRNPLEFYKNYVLGIREREEVEETVAANTLGTVVHETLETFYKPFENKILTEDDFKDMRSKIETEVRNQFKKTYKEAPIKEGKNLIIFEIAKRYVSNFLKREQKLVQQNELKIIEIEDSLKLKLDFTGYDFPIHLRGKVDRVDSLNDQTRIIDYKTGKVLKNELALKNWNDISQDEKYTKAFQVLCYAAMIYGKKPFSAAEAGIISFKNLNADFIKLTFKTDKELITEIDEKMVNLFHVELHHLITEIFNPDIPFTEKETRYD